MVTAAHARHVEDAADDAAFLELLQPQGTSNFSQDSHEVAREHDVAASLCDGAEQNLTEAELSRAFR